MTDYTKACSDGSTMMIRDTGTAVEFWVRSRDTYTYIDGASWSWHVNGGGGNGQYDYPSGMVWRKLGGASVSTAQTVSFTIGSGVTVLGGSTTFSVAITRGSVPPAPDGVTFSSITGVSVAARFNGNGDGGRTIIRWELGYGVSSASPQHVVTSDGTTTIANLNPGVVYYFWARGVNSLGTGPWSGRTSVRTLRIPEATSPVSLSAITSTSMSVHFTGRGSGGSPILRWEIGYGTNSATPQTIVTSSGTSVISDLLPGTVYYFWARGVNSIGNGPWSLVKAAKTVSGAHVLVDGVWRNATPYVNVAGVWRIARPWARSAGVWKETS